MVYLDAHPHPNADMSVDEAILDELPKLPPTNLYSDEPPLETDFHRDQVDLLIRLLKYHWQDRSDFYISGNLTVYYNAQQIKKRDFLGPDIFIVLGAEKRNRRSWTIWEEGGKYPNVVIELLSSSTAAVDKGAKKQLYQDVWRVPNYYWFHPQTMEFAGFTLNNGRYEPIPPTEQGWLWSEQLGLFLGVHNEQLRWWTEQGELIPLPEEQVQQAKEQAERECQRAERLERLLRAHGLDPAQP